MKKFIVSGIQKFDKLVRNVEIVGPPTLIRRTDLPGRPTTDNFRQSIELPALTEYAHIHDVHNVTFNGGRIYASLIDRIGWQSTSPLDPRDESAQGGHGFPVYEQNHTDVEQVIDTSILIAGMVGLSGKAFATNTNTLNWMTYRNSVFLGLFLVGGERYGADEIVFENCVLQGGLRAGYQAANGKLTLRKCVIVDQLAIAGGKTGPAWEHITMEDCDLVDTIGGERPQVTGNLVTIHQIDQKISRTWDIDGNTYHTTDSKPFQKYTLKQWQGYGFDVHGKLIAALPVEPTIRIFPVEGSDTHLANVVICNWYDLPTVPVNLDTLNLTVGAHYQLRQVRDFEDVRPFEYDGKPLLVAMDGTVAPLINWDYEAWGDPPGIPGNLFRRYGVFMIERAEEDPVIIADLTAKLEASQKEVRRLEGELSAALTALGEALMTIEDQGDQIEALTSAKDAQASLLTRQSPVIADALALAQSVEVYRAGSAGEG